MKPLEHFANCIEVFYKIRCHIAFDILKNVIKIDFPLKAPSVANAQRQKTLNEAKKCRLLGGEMLISPDSSRFQLMAHA